MHLLTMRHQIITYFYFLITILATNIGLAKEHYSTNSAEIGFFSDTPIENFKADSKNGVSALNLETGEPTFQVEIDTFQFENCFFYIKCNYAGSFSSDSFANEKALKP